MLVKNTLEYQDKDATLEAYYVFDDTIKTKRPLILVAHDWTGRNEFAMQKAEKLAELGYVGFALDMFGKGKLGKDNEEKMALISPLMSDRALLQRRMLAALQTASQLEQVDASKVAAIGFCFGGLCVLDLARSGADVKGVVSFHGLLNAPENKKDAAIKAKVLALHGHDDPMVPPSVVADFETEMTEAKVDWQLHVYGNTLHAFSNPQANDPALGTVYNKCADKRSWLAMKNFLDEMFLVYST
jgi:dienelactone hydrolase